MKKRVNQVDFLLDINYNLSRVITLLVYSDSHDLPTSFVIFIMLAFI